MACCKVHHEVAAVHLARFGGRQGTEVPAAADPAAVCRALSRAIEEIEATLTGASCSSGAPAAELRRRLEQVHTSLQGFVTAGGTDSTVCEAREEGRLLLTSLLLTDAPARLIACLANLAFEERKRTMRLFSDILRLAPALGADGPVVDYFATHPTIVQLLLEGCGSPCLFAYCAEMLRDCARYPELVKALLKIGAVRLIELARDDSFEISSEAFATIRELLLVQKDVAVPFLKEDFEQFFSNFHEQLLSDQTDYIVKRQGSRLLADMLLCRDFREVMVAYVSDERFLQVHMNALRDKSRSIQLGAFHIFKIFAANPAKPRKVHSILHKNKGGLLKLLASFATEAAQDEVFRQDVEAVVAALEAMDAPAKRQS